MTIFRCKMCGGDLVVNNDTIVICEYCNTKQILSKLEDEIRNKQIDNYEQKIYKIEDDLLDNRVIRIRDVSYKFNIDGARIKAIQTIEKVVKVLFFDVNNDVYDNLDVKSNDNVSSLIRRIFMFLEDGDFHRANKYCERVLDIEPENELAYLGKLMVNFRVNLREDLGNYDEDFSDNIYYKKIVRFGSKELIDELNVYINEINIRNENNRKEKIYQDGIRLMSFDDIDSYKEAIGLFERILEWRDSYSLIIKCREKIKFIEIENEKNFIRNFKMFKKLSVIFGICILFIGIFRLFEDYSTYLDISNKIIGNTFEYDDDIINYFLYYDENVGERYALDRQYVINHFSNNDCIDINGNLICSIYKFTVNSRFGWQKISIYFNIDNTCDINIIDFYDDEMIYENVPYKINLKKELSFDFSKYEDLNNVNYSFIIEEVNDELKIKMINNTVVVFEFNVV